MKRLLTSCAALFLFAGASYAADLPVKAPYAPAPIIPAFSWSGFYAGLNAGYGWSDASVSINGLGGPAWNPYYPDPLRDHSFTRDGFVGGGQIGYNYQINRFVLGAEADFQWTDIQGSFDTSGVGGGGVGPYTLHYDERMDWFGTVRGRLGYTPMDRLLIYGTGGFAFGHVSATSNLDFTGSTQYDQSGSATKTGWTAGGGVEYAFAGPWSAKLEYLYYDLGTLSLVADPSPANPPFQTQTDFPIRGSIVRLGVNYKFGGP
jgi:outer membrane immunogenic protein